jgi:hypothetical protein
VTSDGHPRAIFKRAIERGNLLIAEVTARGDRRISLVEALELTALVAPRDRDEHCGRTVLRESRPRDMKEPNPVASTGVVLSGLGQCLPLSH